MDSRGTKVIGVNHQPAPLSLALLNDYPVVVQGVSRMLENDDRIDVVELDSGEDPSRPVDLVLYDAFAARGGGDHDVVRLLEDARYRKVAVYSWNTSQERVRQALDLGVHGYVSKALSADELADALVRIHGGEHVVLPEPVPEEIEIADWPGRSAGLSPREAEVVALITQGITNEEIARTCYLSINSVKSYIRSAYRKMGVERRSQAVLWGVQNGMQPGVTRH